MWEKIKYIEPLDKEFTAEEIRSTIKKLKNNKATKADGISNEFFKYDDEETASSIKS